MVEVFLVIVVTDRFAEQLSDLFRQCLTVPRPKSLKHRLSVPGLGAVLEPFLDRGPEDLFHLCVGDGQGKRSI